MIPISVVIYVLPADNVISKLPIYAKCGHISKLHLNPDHIPDLHWQITNSANIFIIDMPFPLNNVQMCT